MAESAVSRRLSEVTGVALFGAALLCLVALITYDPGDPAWFFHSASTAATSNFAGPTGAFIAEAFFQLLGFSAYLIPLLAGYLAWHYFWCQKIEAGYTKLVGAGTMAICAAGLLSLAFSAFDAGPRRFNAGGVIGQAIASITTSMLNRTGAAIVLLTLLAFATILATHFSFGAAFTRLGARLRHYQSPLARYRAWREERERERERRARGAETSQEGRPREGSGNCNQSR